MDKPECKCRSFALAILKYQQCPCKETFDEMWWLMREYFGENDSRISATLHNPFTLSGPLALDPEEA